MSSKKSLRGTKRIKLNEVAYSDSEPALEAPLADEPRDAVWSPADQVPLEVWKIIVSQIRNDELSPFFISQFVSLRLVNRNLDLAVSHRFYSEIVDWEAIMKRRKLPDIAAAYKLVRHPHLIWGVVLRSTSTTVAVTGRKYGNMLSSIVRTCSNVTHIELAGDWAMGNAIKALSDDNGNCLLPLKGISIVFSQMPRAELPQKMPGLQAFELVDTVGHHSAWMAETISQLQTSAPNLVNLRIEMDPRVNTDKVLGIIASQPFHRDFYQPTIDDIVDEVINLTPLEMVGKHIATLEAKVAAAPPVPVEESPVSHRVKYLTLQGQVWLGSLNRHLEAFPNLLALNFVQGSRLSRGFPHSPLLTLELDEDDEDMHGTNDDLVEEDLETLGQTCQVTRRELLELLGGEDCKPLDSLHQMLLHIAHKTPKESASRETLAKVPRLSLFQCPKLEHLKLDSVGRIPILFLPLSLSVLELMNTQIEVVVCQGPLVNLKCIHLENVDALGWSLLPRAAFSHLIRQSPALTHLLLTFINGREIANEEQVLKIESPTLRRLDILSTNGFQALHLNCPALRYLFVKQTSIQYLISEPLLQLTEAMFPSLISHLYGGVPDETTVQPAWKPMSTIGVLAPNLTTLGVVVDAITGTFPFDMALPKLRELRIEIDPSVGSATNPPPLPIMTFGFASIHRKSYLYSPGVTKLGPMHLPELESLTITVSVQIPLFSRNAAIFVEAINDTRFPKLKKLELSNLQYTGGIGFRDKGLKIKHSSLIQLRLFESCVPRNTKFQLPKLNTLAIRKATVGDGELLEIPLVDTLAQMPELHSLYLYMVSIKVSPKTKGAKGRGAKAAAAAEPADVGTILHPSLREVFLKHCSIVGNTHLSFPHCLWVMHEAVPAAKA